MVNVLDNQAYLSPQMILAASTSSVQPKYGVNLLATMCMCLSLILLTSLGSGILDAQSKTFMAFLVYQ